MSRAISEGRGLVGRDFQRFAAARRRRLPGVLVLAVLGAALLVTALRVEIIHLGYALGEALERENALEEERRVLAARLEALRSPERLGQLAAARGFARAEHVIDLAPGPPAHPERGLEHDERPRP